MRFVFHFLNCSCTHIFGFTVSFVTQGIVVDVHFASFFLSQILGYQQNALFSAIDELQSLDRELHSSLNYIKHYEGNIEVCTLKQIKYE